MLGHGDFHYNARLMLHGNFTIFTYFTYWFKQFLTIYVFSLMHSSAVAWKLHRIVYDNHVPISSLIFLSSVNFKSNALHIQRFLDFIYVICTVRHSTLLFRLLLQDFKSRWEKIRFRIGTNLFYFIHLIREIKFI